MDRSRVVTLIADVVVDITGEELPRPIIESTVLFGSKTAALDSLGLVSAILEVEQRIEAMGVSGFTIDIAHAMASPTHPFATIGSFADYVALVLRERESV